MIHLIYKIHGPMERLKKDAWTNGKIKENAETFLAALFNLNKIAINGDDLNKK